MIGYEIMSTASIVSDPPYDLGAPRRVASRRLRKIIRRMLKKGIHGGSRLSRRLALSTRDSAALLSALNYSIAWFGKTDWHQKEFYFLTGVDFASAAEAVSSFTRQVNAQILRRDSQSVESGSPVTS